MPATTVKKNPIQEAIKAQARLDAERDAKLTGVANRKLEQPADPKTTAATRLQNRQDAEEKARLLQEETEARNSIFAPAIVVTPTPAPIPTSTQTVTKLATVEPNAKKTKKPVEPKAVKKPVEPKTPRAKKPTKPKVSPMQDVKNYVYCLYKEITKSNAIQTTKDMRKKENNSAHFVEGLVLTRKADWFILCDRLIAHAKDKKITVTQSELIRG